MNDNDAFEQITRPLSYVKPPHDRKCGRSDPGHQPHEWSTPHSRRDGIYYWCEGPTVVEGGRRGTAQ